MRGRGEAVKIVMKRMLLGTIGWGLILWAVGFGLGMMLFSFVPIKFIGWPILAVLLPVTALAAYKRLHNTNTFLWYYLLVAAVWVSVAIVLDYVFLVQAFNAQGYYDLDVTIYYVATFFIPLVTGLIFGRTGKVRAK
ncbi:MAG: hypothetical protein FJ316_04220 [SAR202 cluster bacterium]|nr:hypothetical protein [SAR202 cluster bacterium]